MEPYSGLKQIVPSSLCLTCDVCCRFPEAESVLRPFFTGAEIAAIGASADFRFDDVQGGSKIHLSPHDDGCICPYFDPVTQHCKVYNARPLDCRLYPFALLHDENGVAMLGLDTKCPYIRDHADDPQMARDADAVWQFLASDQIVALLAAHPALIGPYQDDVILLRPLPHLNARLSPPNASAGNPRPV